MASARTVLLLILFAATSDAITKAGDIQVAKVRGPYLRGIDFSQDTALIATGGDRLRVWDTKTGELKWMPQRPAGILTVAFSPTDPRQLVMAQDGGQIVFASVNRKSITSRRADKVKRYVSDVEFSPDGRWLATTQFEQTLEKETNGCCQIWDVKTKKLAMSLPVLKDRPTCIGFSTDVELMAVGASLPDRRDADSFVSIYTVSDWKLLRRIRVPLGFSTAVTFVPRKTKLVIVGGNCIPAVGGCNIVGKIWFADIASDEPAKPLSFDRRYFYFWAAAVTRAGDRFLTGTSWRPAVEDSTLCEIQMRTVERGRILWATDRGIGRPNGVCLSNDGRIVGFCVEDRFQQNAIYLLDAKNGEVLRTINIGQE